MEKLDETLSTLVLKGIELAEQTGEFVIEQAPDLLQQLYMWHTASYIMTIVLCIVVFLSARYVPYIYLDKEKDYNDYKFFGRYGNDGAIMSWFIFAACSLICAVFLIEAVYNLAYILTAPKLYLIEYFIK